MLEHYLSLAVKSIFVENILLAFFLGMCSFLAVSKKIQTAVGLGLAVIFVNTMTAPANWFIYNMLLRKGALSWTGIPALEQMDLSFLVFVSFIAVIAAMVQLVEMFIDKYVPALYGTLGIFLPLIAVNCAILGTSLFIKERDYNFGEAVVFGSGSGIGWALAIISMAAIRKKLRYANPPEGLRDLGLTFIVTGLMAIAFLGFSGIKL
ncbi:MAG: NADH:ubiquinone reductase (Na(+)-transporting) subunit E [Chitinivibrionales bacterium]|nr:NADH:ubiquinone reductase (Na(+)-transporting) subunit E [Chitinivibrionales bacterium]